MATGRAIPFETCQSGVALRPRTAGFVVSGPPRAFPARASLREEACAEPGSFRGKAPGSARLRSRSPHRPGDAGGEGRLWSQTLWPGKGVRIPSPAFPAERGHQRRDDRERGRARAGIFPHRPGARHASTRRSAPETAGRSSSPPGKIPDNRAARRRGFRERGGGVVRLGLGATRRRAGAARFSPPPAFPAERGHQRRDDREGRGRARAGIFHMVVFPSLSIRVPGRRASGDPGSFPLVGAPALTIPVHRGSRPPQADRATLGWPPRRARFSNRAASAS
jgi:hypothetical protein